MELLQRIGPTGKLIALDRDAGNLPQAREKLEQVGHPFALHHGNFAGLAKVLAEEKVEAVDRLMADLGMSSMQVDDPDRGFSYRRDGPLDMRMDRSRGKTAAQLLQTISEAELARALAELGDEPNAEAIARAIVGSRGVKPLERTGDLASLVQEATGETNWVASFAFTSGSARTATASLWILSRTGRGVPAGAMRPTHASASTPAMPASRRVGRSGSRGERSGDVTARSLSLPSRPSGTTDPAGSTASCT